MSNPRYSAYRAAADAANAAVDERYRHRCAYELNGEQCSGMGALSDSTGGPGRGEQDDRRWLCLAHWRLRGDALGSREAMRDLREHLRAAARDWRDEMLDAAGLAEAQIAWRDMGEEERAGAIRRAGEWVGRL